MTALLEYINLQKWRASKILLVSPLVATPMMEEVKCDSCTQSKDLSNYYPISVASIVGS